MRETVYKMTGSVDINLALLSDTHNTDPKPILASLQKHQPQLIAITGDLWVCYKPQGDELTIHEQKNVISLVSGCTDIAPTYISLGNHEWMVGSEEIALLESTGAVVMDNTFLSHTCIGDQEVLIAGLTSSIATYYQQLRETCRETGTDIGRYSYRSQRINLKHFETDTAWLTDFERQDGYKILLCHHPEYWSLRKPRLCERKIDLVLSGHAHGGQMRIFNQGVYAPGQGWLPKFTSGVYDGEWGHLVISRGLANTAQVPRVFNETELVYVEVNDYRSYIGGRDGTNYRTGDGSVEDTNQ